MHACMHACNVLGLDDLRTSLGDFVVVLSLLFFGAVMMHDAIAGLSFWSYLSRARFDNRETACRVVAASYRAHHA